MQTYSRIFPKARSYGSPVVLRRCTKCGEKRPIKGGTQSFRGTGFMCAACKPQKGAS